MFLRSEEGWKRVSLTRGTAEPSSWTDEHVFCGDERWGYIVVLPPDPVLEKIEERNRERKRDAVMAQNDAGAAFQAHLGYPSLRLAADSEDGCGTCREAYRGAGSEQDVLEHACPDGKNLYQVYLDRKNEQEQTARNLY
jgi:hypothetical protein